MEIFKEDTEKNTFSQEYLKMEAFHGIVDCNAITGGVKPKAGEQLGRNEVQ